MNSNIIETTGISYLKIFLGKTKKIDSPINQRDKYPIWDGEILLYNSEKFLVDNLYCRVPVQVKSSLSEQVCKEKVSYPIKKVELEKYADDGGVLFIQVLFNENDEKNFYMNLLLPADIYEILSKLKKTQVSVNVPLQIVDKPDEVITICKNYKIHSKLQAQIPKKIDIKKINGPVELVSYSYINNINDLVTKQQYAYAKLGEDFFGYVGKYVNKSLAGVVKISIGTDNRIYYDEIVEIITADEHYYMLGKYVRIQDNKIIINNELIDDNIIPALNDLEFVCDLLENKNIIIGKKRTIFSFKKTDEIENKIKIAKNRVLYFKSALEVIKKVGLSLNVANIKKVIADEKLICDIRNIVINGQTVSFDNENERFVDIVNVLNQKYLIYFVKNKTGYKGYNFIKDEIVLKNLFVEEDNAQLSRYFNMKADVLHTTKLDFDEIKKEIKLATKNEYTISFISNLVLEFIKCYDITYQIMYLDIAEYINKLIRNCDGYSEAYYLLNKYQMLRRRKRLSNEEIKNIKKIKIDNLNDLNIVCACCLLCDDYDEFSLYYEKMNEEEKNIFKSWSIYKFYKSSKIETDEI